MFLTSKPYFNTTVSLLYIIIYWPGLAKEAKKKLKIFSFKDYKYNTPFVFLVCSPASRRKVLDATLPRAGKAERRHTTDLISAISFHLCVASGQ